MPAPEPSRAPTRSPTTMPSPTYPPVKPWIAARQALNPDLASDPEIPVTQIAQVAVGKVQ